MYLPLSLMLGYLDDSLLIRFAHRDSVSVGAGSKTIHLPFLQKPTQKNQQKGVFFPASEGTFGVEVPHNASGKRNIAIAALGPGDAGPAARGLPCFLCSRLTPSGPPLGTTFIPWPWKEHVFPRISCCRRFPETDTQFCLAQRLKEKKKMYVYMGQIYLFLKVNYLCLTTQVLPLQKKAFEKQAVSATCLQDSRQNDSRSWGGQGSSAYNIPSLWQKVSDGSAICQQTPAQVQEGGRSVCFGAEWT